MFILKEQEKAKYIVHNGRKLLGRQRPKEMQKYRLRKLKTNKNLKFSLSSSAKNSLSPIMEVQNDSEECSADVNQSSIKIISLPPPPNSWKKL